MQYLDIREHTYDESGTANPVINTNLDIREHTYDESGTANPVINAIYNFKDYPSIVQIKERINVKGFLSHWLMKIA